VEFRHKLTLEVIFTMLPCELERLSALRERALSLPAGAPLRIVTTNGRRFQGAFLSADDDDILHLRLHSGHMVFLIEEIHSLRRLDRPRFPHVAAARRFLVALFASIFSLFAADVRQQAVDTPNGATIRVKTTSKQEFRAKLLSVSAEGIDVHVIEKDLLTPRTFAFDEIQSIKRLNQPIHPGWVVAIVYGVLIAIGAILGG